MSTAPGPTKRKLPLVKLALAGVVLGAIGVLLLRGVNLRQVAEDGMTLIRAAGPWVFFTAMTILPAFGVPMLAFTVPAGEAFAGQMGMPAVIVVALTALAVNLALGYWVSRYALRPVLAGLLKRYGYSVPRITPENALRILLLVRLTPGPPYAFQAFILGVAEAPFRLYMIVSWLCVLPYALAGIVLGQGLFDGNFKVVMFAIGSLVAVGIGVQWAAKRYFAADRQKA